VPSQTSARVARRATAATYAVFILSGFAFASWASRIPQVRDALHLTPRTLGLVLLAIAVGSVTSMPLAGLIVAQLGTGRTVAVMALVAAAGLAVTGLGYSRGVVPVVVGLFAFGVGNGTWDVAMNVEGAAVEQELGRAIMPRFHAGFSIGTVAGALGGAAMVVLGVSARVHLLGVAFLVALATPLAVRGFLPDRHAPSSSGGAHNPLKAWLEPRTLLIGLFVFAAAFTEGTGNDWLGVAMIDGYGAAAALGALTFAIFLSAMTIGRWFGPGLIDRYGRVLTIRIFGALALAGLSLVVWGSALPVAMVGAALWGLGTALGFPVGMSAASDEAAHAPARVSVVATIGYIAFLAGPPLIGFLGQHTGTLHALTVTGGLVALGLLISGVLRPLPDRERAPAAAAAGADVRP
jgi:predicted MFS family arabinose efflux permease